MESPYRNRPAVPRNAPYIQVIPSEIVETARQAVPQVPGIPYVSEGQIIPSWVQPGQCQAAPVPVPMPIQSRPQPLSAQPQADCYKGLIPIRNQMIFLFFWRGCMSIALAYSSAPCGAALTTIGLSYFLCRSSNTEHYKHLILINAI